MLTRMSKTLQQMTATHKLSNNTKNTTPYRTTWKRSLPQPKYTDESYVAYSEKDDAVCEFQNTNPLKNVPLEIVKKAEEATGVNVIHVKTHEIIHLPKEEIKEHKIFYFCQTEEDVKSCLKSNVDDSITQHIPVTGTITKAILNNPNIFICYPLGPDLGKSFEEPRCFSLLPSTKSNWSQSRSFFSLAHKLSDQALSEKPEEVVTSSSKFSVGPKISR